MIVEHQAGRLRARSSDGKSRIHRGLICATLRGYIESRHWRRRLQAETGQSVWRQRVVEIDRKTFGGSAGTDRRPSALKRRPFYGASTRRPMAARATSSPDRRRARRSAHRADSMVHEMVSALCQLTARSAEVSTKRCMRRAPVVARTARRSSMRRSTLSTDLAEVVARFAVITLAFSSSVVTLHVEERRDEFLFERTLLAALCPFDRVVDQPHPRYLRPRSAAVAARCR